MRDRVYAKQCRAAKTNRVGTAMRNAAERANRRSVNIALATQDWEGMTHVELPKRVVVRIRPDGTLQ